MSIDAIAILRVPYATLCAAHDKRPASDVASALDETFPFVPVGSDATACFLLVHYASAPADLAVAARQVIGASLDAHSDERGVPVMADVSWPESGFASYEAAVARIDRFVPKLDEAGLVASLEARLREAGMGDFAPQVARMQIEQAASGPDALRAQADAIEKLMAAHPEAAKAAEAAMNAQLARATDDAKAQHASTQASPFAGMPMDLGNPDLMAAAEQMLAGMAPEQRRAIEQMAAQLLGGGGMGGMGGMGSATGEPDIIDDEFGDGSGSAASSGAEAGKPAIVDDEFGEDEPPAKK